MKIKVTPPFSFNECLHFLGRSSHECLHHTTSDSVTKLLKIGNEVVLFQLTAEDQNHLSLHFLNTKPNLEVVGIVKSYVSDWFDLEAALQPFYDIASTDEILQGLAEQYYGLRLIGIPNLFEALSWSVIGQQINLTFAYTLKARYVQQFGEQYDFNGQTYFVHPAPETVACLTASDFLPLQFNRKKAEYLIGIARMMEDGSLSKQLLQQMSYHDAHQALVSIRGIGNWTANYVLMKCLRHSNALPVEDVGLQNAIKNQLQLSAKPTVTEIHKIAEQWKGVEAYATFYLWRSLIKHE